MLQIDINTATKDQKVGEALRLFWNEGKNYAEIGQLFGMSRQRIHQLIPGEGAKKQALRKLEKDKLKKEKRIELLARVEQNKNNHGTEYTYKYYGCRCDLCKAANTQAMAERRSRVRLTVDLNSADIIHGTTNTYRYYGCRCDKCKEAHRISCNTYYTNKKAA
jgi:Fe-S cluster assembly iron-binding protein IscA